MLRVPLNVGKSAAYCQGNVREFCSVWRVVTLVHPQSLQVLDKVVKTIIVSGEFTLSTTTANKQLVLHAQ